jgi:hypothetical protein
MRLDLEFCGASLVFGAKIENGKILEIQVDKEEEMEWRQALVRELRLDEGERMVPGEKEE